MNDVDGHARAIEVITEELARHQNLVQLDITQLAANIFAKLVIRYNTAVSVIRGRIFPVVQCVLSRRKIRLIDSIPGSDLLWESVTAPGLIWFERAKAGYDYDASGYLVAPYFWLWMLARLTDGERNNHLYQFLSSWDFNDYKELLCLETGIGFSGNITWQNFETFCCYFRILRSLGFEDGQEVPLMTLHSGCKLQDYETMVVNRHLKYAKAVHQYGTASTATAAEDIVTKYNGTLDASHQLSYVILNAPNAPAGDFFLSIKTLIQCTQAKIVREVGQCKLVQKKLTQGMYDKEREKSIRQGDIFMLYTTTEISDDFKLPVRSGIVDSSCWQSYFGPFAGRAFIASRYLNSRN